MYSEGFHQEKYKSIKNLLGFYLGSLKDPNNYRGQRKALIIKHRYNIIKYSSLHTHTHTYTQVSLCCYCLVTSVMFNSVQPPEL